MPLERDVVGGGFSVLAELCPYQLIEPTAHLVDGSMDTHTSGKKTHKRAHTLTLKAEGMPYLKLISTNEHIHADLYQPAHTLGQSGWRTGSRGSGTSGTAA